MRAFDCEAINLGAAGIVLGLATLDSAMGVSTGEMQIRDGARWLASRPAEGNAAGLFSGNAGVALALAVAGQHLDEPAFIAAARRRLEVAAADRRETDLFSGSAGVLWTACVLSEVLHASWPLEAGAQALEPLRAQAGEIGNVPVWIPERTQDKAFLGCAHGTAGVAMALACWGRRTNDRTCLDAAIDAFKRIAAHGRTEEGTALRITIGSTRHHAVGNWCHGVGGYLWALLQGVGDEPALREEIAWAVSALAGAPSAGTPTCCHGLAGQLELWRMLGGIERYRTLALARAGKVARALWIVHHEVDGRCAWISDDPGVVTPDLWIGFLGPATSLAMHLAGVESPLLSARWLAVCAQEAPRIRG
jgi:lantibiotic modifying enzyme